MSKGKYLYLIMCWICFLIVSVNNITKYITRIGQYTGISKMENKDNIKDKVVATVLWSQNLNSGSLLMKGRNSSSCDSSPPSSKLDDFSSCSKDGSNFGVKNERNKLKRSIANP